MYEQGQGGRTVRFHSRLLLYKRQADQDSRAEILERRSRFLDSVHRQMKKYFDRIPPYIVGSLTHGD